jgi:hypothetical protein
VFLDPAKTLRALVKRVSKGVKKTPFIVLVSALSDQQTMELIEAVPQVRAVVLPADTLLLGQAWPDPDPADPTKPTQERYSGDLGMATLVDADKPAAARLFVRPIWWGETGGVLSAALSRCESGDPPPHCDAKTMWEVKNAEARTELIGGAELRASAEGGLVVYTADLNGIETPLGRYPVYQTCEPSQANEQRCKDFLSIWGSHGSAGAVVADILRRAAAAETAVLPLSYLDEYYLDWLARRARAEGSHWISDYVLERIFFRSPRIVRAYVPGDELVATLKKILELPTSGDGYCVAGLSLSCPAAIDGDHPEKLRVNGRPVESRLFYSIALPDGLAESLSLKHSDTRPLVDAKTKAAERLGAFSRWDLPAERDGDTVGTRLERKGNRRPQMYWALAPAEFGLTRLTLHDPEKEADLRKNLPIETSGAKPSRTVSVSLGSDVAALDMPWFALRVPARVDFLRRKDLPPGLPTSIAYDKDEFSAGVRADLKVPLARGLRFYVGELRLYVGRFRDGALKTHAAKYQAVAVLDEAAGISQTALFATEYSVKPLQFRHWRVGGEALDVQKVPLSAGLTLSLKKFGVDFSRGTATNVVTDVSIGGVPLQSLDLVLSKGIQAVLNDYYTSHRETFSAATTLEPVQGPSRQTRWQFDADVELGRKVRGSDAALGLTARYRAYPTRVQSDFALASTLKVTLKLTLPVASRVSLAPVYEYDYAYVGRESERRFATHRFEIRASVPILWKWSHGTFFR